MDRNIIYIPKHDMYSKEFQPKNVPVGKHDEKFIYTHDSNDNLAIYIHVIVLLKKIHLKR